MPTDHDRLFKELITTFFREFMEAFFPEVHKHIDYSFLEFMPQEVFTDVTAGEKKRIDILVKTRLMNEEGFVLIHVEPQARKEKDFAKRMFKYFARLHEKYDLKVLPIAVLAHEIKKREPDSYEVRFPSFTTLNFRFLQLHLKRLSWREYLQNDNPAVAALLSKMGYTEDERLKLKLEFFKMLLRLKLDPARMELLSGFFDSYVLLTSRENEEFTRKIMQELQPEEVDQVSKILTSWHKQGIEEGRKEGRIEGRKEGRIEGKIEGKIDALKNMIIRLARKKFNGIEATTETTILKINNPERLESIVENILDIHSEEELLRLINLN